MAGIIRIALLGEVDALPTRAWADAPLGSRWRGVKMRLLIGIIIALSLTLDAIAQGPVALDDKIVLVKHGPAEVAFDEIFSISINVTNTGSETKSVTIIESAAALEIIEPLPVFMEVPAGIYAARPPEISWTITVPAGATETLVYKAKPRHVGHLSVGPTVAHADGMQYYSDTLSIFVRCAGGACNPAIGENHLICPEKCPLPEPKAGQAPRLRANPSLLTGGVVLVGVGAVLWLWGSKFPKKTAKKQQHKEHK